MYITRDDVLLGLAKMELVQLTNDDPYGSEPDLAVLDRAIEYACELADGYLMGRYTLPLDPAPSMLRHLCTDIARHWLHRRRINTADFPKPLEAAYSNAIKILEQIRDGKIQLGVRGLPDAATEKLRPEQGVYLVRGKGKMDLEGY